MSNSKQAKTSPSAEKSILPPGCPDVVVDFVVRALDAVRTSVGIGLEFDSETLPLVDHYLREVPDKSPETAILVGAMIGAYFGETVRACLNGNWKIESEDPHQWRIVLPGGLSFCPAALSLSAILCSETHDGNGDFQAPPLLLSALEETLGRMGTVSSHEYYTLSCRFDTLEHLQETLLAVAADRAAKSN